MTVDLKEEIELRIKHLEEEIMHLSQSHSGGMPEQGGGRS